MEEKHVLLPFLWNILALTLNELSALKLSTSTFISLLTLISSCLFQINVCELGISFHNRTFGLLDFIPQSTAYHEEKVFQQSYIYCLTMERPVLGCTYIKEKILSYCKSEYTLGWGLGAGQRISSAAISMRGKKEKQQSLFDTYVRVTVFVRLTWQLKKLNHSNMLGGLQDYYISKCL